MEKYCQICGKINKTNGSICQRCYRYLRRHPEGKYEIPSDGVVKYALNGDVICHICGEAHRRLGSHIKIYHGMTQNEYRDKFKLYHNTKLSNVQYIEKMSELNKINSEKVVAKNLLKNGIRTRVSHNHHLKGRKYNHKITILTTKA